ncbi:hypothetical protein F4677DRAFT_450156 [Hypoxylon crocopeplum]|nr:hypothetical protein F4677DRAFT_450156 [Hypoxylon crocopeplum]
MSVSHTPEATSCAAVFSDDWNWPFNTKSRRSRRRRFAHSGERITGFTAVFCDDWKDSKGEDDVSLSGYDSASPQSSGSFSSYEGHNEDGDMDNLHNFEDCDEFFSASPPYKRQRRDHFSMSRAGTALSATSINCQQCQLGASSPDTRWPPSTPTLDGADQLFMTPTDDSETFSRGPATPDNSTFGTSNFQYQMPMNVVSLAEIENNQRYSKSENQSIDPASLSVPMSKGGNRTWPSTENKDYFLTDGWSTKSNGFDFWDQLLEWCIGADEGQSSFPKSSYERDIQEFVNW